MPTEVGWGKHYYYPRAIIHADGDGFFAACEVARDPTLRGKPVVTGAERGIVSAATYEAKARGISRGVRLADVKKICPEAIILPADYELYTLYSLRMYEIMRRYTPEVEEYGVDECFGDITGLRRTLHMDYETIARKLKEDLYRELDITFSVGLSCTKTLAKIGSKYQKPDGFTPIPLTEKDRFLADTKVGSVWGIGPQTTALLNKYGVQTALEFAQKDEAWVRRIGNKPIVETWQELNGISIFDLVTEKKEDYHSIQKTKTFAPSSSDAGFIFSQLSKNMEGACVKARRYGLSATGFSFFLKSQQFRYRGCEVKLARASNAPHEMLAALRTHFLSVYKAGTMYRATGVTLVGLHESTETQLDLFTDPKVAEGVAHLFEKVDDINDRYGRNSVYLASSMKAIAASRVAAQSERGIGSSSRKRTEAVFSGRNRKKVFKMPYLGEVT